MAARETSIWNSGDTVKPGMFAKILTLAATTLEQAGAANKRRKSLESQQGTFASAFQQQHFMVRLCVFMALRVRISDLPFPHVCYSNRDKAFRPDLSSVFRYEHLLAFGRFVCLSFTACDYFR